MKKPDTRTAMARLIGEIRAALPFDAPETRYCGDDCRFCAPKLLAYLESELEEWEQRLADGGRPDFGDLNRLARSARRIHRALQRNGLLPASAADAGQEHDRQTENEP
ncbi:MAG TPA: hypothetical protein ENI96_10535 [Sedimenticola thiotaurini]|uniref:Uncharacterized protein n=1 Tax=Sedimenticola thiotaurini TaxID=1543721 RepID=A0A831RPK1_9GAMM|nr:hypothetical protein [Sedimenticola thiotaurini]